MVSITTGCFTPGGKSPPVSIEQEAGRPAERLWTMRGLSREKTLDSPGNFIVKYPEDKKISLFEA